MQRLHRFFYILTFILLAAHGAANRYTVIVSLDGCRYDYAQAYNTPFFSQMAHEGVSAEMRPSFPSSTFPNHYTLATGLVPDHHGIIANRFTDKATGLVFSLSDKRTKQDPRFWGGEPIWQTLSRQGLRTGVVYWPGSDVAVNGKYPTYYKDYEQRPLLTFAARIAEVLRLLSLPEAERPQLVMAYFEEPDHSGHAYGPQSPETRRSVESMDVLMEQLYEGLRALPIADSINFIVTGDHGMTAISAERMVPIAARLDKAWVERIDYGIPTLVYTRKGYAGKVVSALSGVSHIRAYLKADVPSHLHYGGNANVGDVVIVPDLGWNIGDRAPHYKGTHGYDPAYSDMHVMFRAVGPDFKRGYAKPATFANVDVYSLLCRLAGVAPAKTDGSLDGVSDMLVRP